MGGLAPIPNCLLIWYALTSTIYVVPTSIEPTVFAVCWQQVREQLTTLRIAHYLRV